MHPYKRSTRVGDLIREEIADIIMHKLRDPRIGFVTVTGAEISEDLRHATIYLSVLDEERRKDTLGIIRASASFIRGELGKRLRIKYIPFLTFRIDESIEYGMKIDRLLDEIKAEERPEDDEDII
jgi:ribosome-binding factor A